MENHKKMKVLTKRKGKPDPIHDAKIFLKTIRRIKGNRLIQRGVYRFGSFEEADQWMIQNMANTHARLS